MQYLRPVGAGPSSNICPKWAPQLEQCASVRVIKKLRSTVVPTASSAIGAKKLGQPVPDSYFVLLSNKA